MRLRASIVATAAALLFAACDDSGPQPSDAGERAEGEFDAAACPGSRYGFANTCDAGPCSAAAPQAEATCSGQRAVPRCEDGYWNQAVWLSCEAEAETSTCDPRGTWTLTHEPIVPPGVGGEHSFCAGIPSAWRLEIEQGAHGALQLLFARADMRTDVTVGVASLSEAGCHIDFSAVWNQQSGSETLFVDIDFALDLDGDALTGSAAFTYASLFCGDKTTVTVNGTRSAAASR